MIRSIEYLKVISDRYEKVYVFACDITHDKITKILAEVKSTIQAEYNLIKRIYAVVNELLENTLVHGNEEKNEVELVILEDQSCFRIISFNSTSNKVSESFLAYSSGLNEMSRSELKTQYKEKLLHGTINDKGTIGVGMELIRLKSKNKILISTEESDEDRVIIIDVKIDK